MTTNNLKHWKEQGCLDDEEIVTIVYFYGNSANVKINVTGDSLLAIVNDVTKRLLV